MPCRRHRTWHPTPSQDTVTGLTCRAVHWWWMSHKLYSEKPQLTILMSWILLDWDVFPRLSTLAANVHFKAILVAYREKPCTWKSENQMHNPTLMINPGTSYSVCPRRQFHTQTNIIQSQVALPNFPNAWVPSREVVSPSAEADSPSRPQYIVHPKQYILTPLWII